MTSFIFAAKVAVMLMVFGRDNLLPLSEGKAAISRMNHQLAGIVETRVARTARQRRDPCSRFNMVSQRFGKYACMKQWAYAHGYVKPKRVFSALIQITDDGYSYGFASGACDLRYGFTMTTFGRSNQFGDRTEYSRIALIHELSHIYGANHDQSNCNVMHENALACIEPTWILDFNQTAINRIFNCTWGR